MSKTQQTVIYIKDENIEEAKFMSRNFIDKEVKTRAYINTLGAEVLKTYLESEGIDVSELYNLHSISRILESNDIADLILDNIHIDTRIIFDDNQIFVPKAHFDKGIVPDAYAVIKFDDEYETAEFLGYFTPSQIDKNNQNKNYYFVDKKELKKVSTFKKYIKNFVGKAPRELSEDDFLKGRELAVKLSDHDITKFEEKELFELLLLSKSLRESILEFDNFETLAYNSISEITNTSESITENTPVTPILDTKKNPDSNIMNVEVQDDLLGDDMLEDDNIPAPYKNIEEPDLNLDDDITLEDVSSNIELENIDENKNETDKNIEQDIQPNELDVDDIKLDELQVEENLIEPTLIEDNEQLLDESEIKTEEAISEENKPIQAEPKVEIETEEKDTKPIQKQALSVDDILDRTIAAIDNEKTENKKSNLANNIVSALEKTAEVTASTTENTAKIIGEGIIEGAAAAGAIAATESVASTVVGETAGAIVSDSAIKLASVSGDLTQSIIEQNIEKQNEKLNQIDFNNLEQIPEEGIELGELEPVDLTLEENTLDDTIKETITQNEKAKETELESNDLSEVNNKGISIASEITQQNFEHETVDLENMEHVANDNYPKENPDTLSDIEEISPDENIRNQEDDFIELHGISESEVVDLPMTDYTINEDGTSNIDNYTPPIDLNYSEDTQLLDMPPLEDKMETNIDSSELNNNDNEILTDEDIDKTLSESQNEISQESADEFNFEDFEQFIEDDNTQDTTNNDDLSKVSSDGNTVAFESLEETSGNDDFADLSDFETINETSVEDMISEPDETKLSVIENSTVISDKTYTVGEIPIDINQTEFAKTDNTPLGKIYNDSQSIPGESLIKNPGRVGKTNTNNAAPVIGGILGGLVVLIMVGVIGFFAAKFFKNPQEEMPQPITDDNIPTSTENTTSNNVDKLNVDANNVVKMDNNTNALASTSKVNTARKSGKAISFVDVRKLTWDVPDYVSYNANFRQYFQSAGKSLKLALVSDLLLAKDFIYSSPVKVSVTFTKDGTFKNSQIINSSGSTEIDSIVLQTVNQTLKSLKAPHSVGNDESTTAILKIYF